MAGNAIGTGAVVLTANADGLASGLAKASEDVFKFGEGVGTTLEKAGSKSWMSKLSGGIGSAISTVFGGKGMLSGLQSLGGDVATKISGWATAAKGGLTSAGTAIGTALGGPIGAAIGGAVGSAVGELGVTVAGALGSPFEKIDEFAKTVKKASVLGISGSQYQGLTQSLAKVGIEGEQVDVVFAKLGNTLTKAANGDMMAGAMFQKLGLDAKQLAGQPLDQTFLSIADAISKLPSPAEQANAAIAAFGKNGVALLPQLQQGGKGIQDFIDQQKKMGAVLSDSQLKAAADASKAWKGAKAQISAAWEGLKNRATIIVAPIIEFAGKAVSKAFALATPVFEWMGRAIETVADIARAVFEQLTVWFEEGIGWVKSWTAELGTFTGGWPTVRTVIVEVFRGIGIAAALAWDTVKAGAGVFAVVAGTCVESGMGILSVFRRLVDLLKHLPDDVKPSWLNGFIEGVDKADDKFRAWGTGLKNWGKDAVTGWGQSAQKFSDWLDRALAPKKPKAADMKPPAASGAATSPEVWQPAKLAGAVEMGTKEAYSITAKALYGDFAKAEDVHKENGKKLDKGNSMMEQILGKLGALEGAIEGI